MFNPWSLIYLFTHTHTHIMYFFFQSVESEYHEEKDQDGGLKSVLTGVLISIVSLFADPNCSSPANVDAGVSIE